MSHTPKTFRRDFLRSMLKGKVVGAIGFHTQTGDVYVFKAKAIILAPGGIKGLPYAKPGPEQPIGGSIMPNNLTGGGFAMAFRAGAELMNMELSLVELWCRETLPALLR